MAKEDAKLISDERVRTRQEYWEKFHSDRK